MSAGVTIKTLSADIVRGNIDALIAVAADVSGEYWAAENFLADRPAKWELSFGLWQGDALIGYAIMSEPSDKHIHLHHFMVAAVQRNQGFGDSMLSEMLARCLKAGAQRLTLKTPKENTGAIRFYTRYGFVQIGRESGHIVMVKSF